MKGIAVSLTDEERIAVLRACQSRIAALIQLSIKETMAEIDALDDVVDKLREKV